MHISDKQCPLRIQYFRCPIIKVDFKLSHLATQQYETQIRLCSGDYQHAWLIFLLLFFNEFLFPACPIFFQKHVRNVRLLLALADREPRSRSGADPHVSQWMCAKGEWSTAKALRRRYRPARSFVACHSFSPHALFSRLVDLLCALGLILLAGSTGGWGGALFCACPSLEYQIAGLSKKEKQKKPNKKNHQGLSGSGAQGCTVHCLKGSGLNSFTGALACNRSDYSESTHCAFD